MLSPILATMLLRMVVVATVVVVVAAIAERSRPAIAALIATLPISIGPTYVLLALDHNTAFLAASALKSVASTGATLGFIAAYANSAARLAPLPALAVAYAVWVPLAMFVHIVDWSIPTVVVFVALVSAVAMPAMRRLKETPDVPAVPRRWWEVPFRGMLVALLVAVVTGLSELLGTSGVGTLANFPIVMTSVTLLLHLRLGGGIASAMLANTTGGMIGITVALLALHLSVEPLGAPLGLAVGLAVSVVWNLVLYWQSQRSQPVSRSSRSA